MPSKHRINRKRKQEWYAENLDSIKKRKFEQTNVSSTNDRSSLNKWYEENARRHKFKKRQRYLANHDTTKAQERKRYASDPELFRAKKRMRYAVDTEHRRIKKREQYKIDCKPNRGKAIVHYRAGRLSRIDYFRFKYKNNVLNERLRKKSTNQVKSALNSRCRKRKIGTVSKRGKHNKGKEIFLGKLNTEKIARKIAQNLRVQGYAARLLKAKELLKWALTSHKYHKNDFRSIYTRLQTHCTEVISRLDSSETYQDKVNTLCGPSLHTAASEPYFWEFTYKVFSGKPIAIDLQHQAANIFPSYSSSTKGSLVRHTWKCSTEICQIEESHLDQLKSLLSSIVSCSVKEGSKVILNMAEHLPPRLGVHQHSLRCYSGLCTSKLPFLRMLGPHFPEIRAFVSTIYKLIRIARKMIMIRDGIRNTKVKVLMMVEKRAKDRAKAFLAQERDTKIAMESESELMLKYYNAFKAFEKRSSDIPILPCVACDKLFSKRQVSLIQNLKSPVSGQVWLEIKRIKSDECKTGYICRGCLDKLRKDEMPASCVANSLHVGIQPKELNCLNSYEKILIQRAKTFQVVTKMKTVSNKKCTASHQISKVVGRCFHLPLPLEETLKKLPNPSDPLNQNYEIYVVVRGVPTKTNKVWQMLVSVDKVYCALKLLKTTNPLYSKIILPSQPQELFSSTQDISMFQLNNESENLALPILQRRGILTQVTRQEWESEESHYTIHALHEPKAYSDDTELYKMLKVNEDPISHENKDIDLLCFPDLYPEGKFGQFHPRKVRLTSAEFIKCRLLSRDSRFRLNQQYLFYLLHDANFRQLKQGIFHKLNVTAFKGSLTAGECLNNLTSGELEGNLTSVFSKLRNTSQYWVQPRNDVNCMAQHYGPATWFLTMSPSDWNWDDMALFIRQVDKDMPGLESKQTNELVAIDPVSASRFINNKFHAVLDFILSDDAPLGKVKHYFYRREYQCRGLQHFHLLLWVEGAPILGKNSNAEVADFIMKYVSCKLPVHFISPTLYSRVVNYQTHHHNSYCKRNKKTKTGFCSVCRFGFPRPVTESLVLRDVVESVAGRKALKTKSRLYDLPRLPNERLINDYNPALMLAWNGNVDLQYVGEKTSILHGYVTKYTTKSEQSHAGELFTEINSTKPLATKLFNIGLRALNNRECGSLEASDTLLGIPLYGTDQDTTIRWLDVAMVRRKRLHKINKISKLDPGSKDIFYESWVDDHYPKRPAQLQDMNLYNFVRWFDIIGQPLKSNRETYKLSCGKYLIKRLKPCLLNHYKYSVHQEPEKYYYALLLMFLPWRNTEDLKGIHKTFTKAFVAQKDHLNQAVEYDNRLKDIAAVAEEAKEKIQIRVNEIEAEEKGGNSHTLNETAQPPAEPLPVYRSLDEICCPQNEETYDELCHQLNSDQLRVFHHVKELLLNTNGENNVLRHFVSGVGGTGKSFLIKTISCWTNQFLQASTSISAPTGLSAYNINGSTIYKVFQLPVEHGRTPKYRTLSDDALKSLRAELKNVVLFVIDEVSMVSNLTLMYINLRLCEIFNTSDKNDGWFGQKHMLLLGDLLQLPPVHEDSPFVQLPCEKLNSYTGSLSCINVWSEKFTYDELTINMRQSQDTRYADILSRVRTGSTSADDVMFIESKKIRLNGKSCSENLILLGDYLSTLLDDTVCICATGNQCIKINNEMLNRVDGDVVNLVAKDSVECDPRQRKKANKVIFSYDSDCSRTAGMERIISIKVGAKVMLRRNIDVTVGLVNSAIGTIRELKFSLDHPSEVDTVIIRFESGVTYPLQRVTAKFQVMDNAFVYRQQFPISVSYAITIHKCQGLSLKSAVIDIGESVFTCGQSYVALSRVTSSEGLHLINFNPRDVKAQKTAILEYNRLRQRHRPDLPLYNANEVSVVPYAKDRKWCQTKKVDEVQEGITVAKPQFKNRRFTGGNSRPVKQATSKVRGFKNNDHVSCYANALIQMLYSSNYIKEIIKSSEHVSPKFKEHLKMYEELPPQAELDTLAIRSIVGGNIYTLREQQDCALFLLDLIQTNHSITKTICYGTVATINCQRCGYTFRGPEVEDYIIRVPLNLSKGTLAAYLHSGSNTKWEPIEDYRCTNVDCGLLGTCRRKTEITRMSRHVVVQFLIFNNNADKIFVRNMTGTSNSQVIIGGKQFKPTAAIFHYGHSIKEGHFVCLMKMDNSWVSANDENIEKKRWPVGSKDLYMLLLTET